MDLKGVTITWLGHGTYLFEHGGKKTLLDPWVEGNPACPESYHDLAPDAVLITHGHGDHIGDVFSVAERSSGPIVGIFDLTTWLGMKGVDGDRLVGMNKGGTVRMEELGFSITMTDAHHSSSFVDDGQIVYLGEPAGFVIHFDEGLRVYAAGDTCLFGDMEWIKTLYKPDVAILPIGDHFTMDPLAAAHATNLLGVRAVIPGHYATFPLLHGTPGQLEENLAELGLGDIEVFKGDPGTSWS